MISYPKELRKNLLFRQQLLAKCRDSAPLRKEVLERCAKDVHFWVNTFCMTLDPRRDPAKIPFITYPFQDELLTELDSACNEGRDLRIEKSRDMGVSWVTCAWMTWRILFKPNQMFLMLSRKETLVDGDRDSLFAHVDVILKALPGWMKPKITRTRLSIVNEVTESVIEGESTNSDAGRGGRRTAILWDEAAACPGGGDDIAAATQANTNCRILNSTPKGESNYFAACRKTTKTFRAHWSKHPEKCIGLYRPMANGIEIIDANAPPDYRYRMERPSGPEGLRSPWYDKQCDRTPNPVEIAAELDIDYAGSDYPFFSAEKLDELIARTKPPLYRGDLEYIGGEWGFAERTGGPLSLWINIGEGPNYQFPVHRNFVVACDIGQGTGASDSVAVIVDRDTGEKIGEWVSNRTGVQDFAATAVGLCKVFAFHGRPCLLVWDGGGPGRSFAKYVTQDLKYRNVYYHESSDIGLAVKTTDLKRPGWFPNRELKRALLIEYRDALSCGRFRNCSERALAECKQFKNMPDGGIEHVSIAMAQDGGDNHGDRVIADALAWKMISVTVGRAEDRTPGPVFSYPVGSIGWLMKQEESRERSKFKTRGW